MTYSATILADSPAAAYPLGEASSASPADNAQGNAALDGAYQGTPTLGAAGALAGDSGTAMGPLSGSGQYVYIGANAALNFGDVWSIEAWVSRGATGAARTIASKSTGAYGLLLLNDGRIRMERANSQALMDTTGALGTGWHHVVATKNGASGHIWVDATEPAHGTYTDATCADNGNPFLIGADSDSGNLSNATLQWVVVYNFALTSTQVAAHYAAGTTAGDLFLMLEDGSGAYELEDASGGMLLEA